MISYHDLIRYIHTGTSIYIYTQTFGIKRFFCLLLQITQTKPFKLQIE